MYPRLTKSKTAMAARMIRASRTARTMVAVVAPPSSSWFPSFWWSTSMSLLIFIPSRLLKDCKGFVNELNSEFPQVCLLFCFWFHLAMPAASSLVRKRTPSSSSVNAVRKRREEESALAYKEESLQNFRKCLIIWQVFCLISIHGFDYIGCELRIRNQTVMFIPSSSSREKSTGASYTITFSLASPSTCAKEI